MLPPGLRAVLGPRQRHAGACQVPAHSHGVKLGSGCGVGWRGRGALRVRTDPARGVPPGAVPAGSCTLHTHSGCLSTGNARSQVLDGGRATHCMWALTSREADREQQRLLELRDRALNHMAGGIFIAARDTGALVYVNQGFVRLTGFAADEAIGQPWTFLQARRCPCATRPHKLWACTRCWVSTTHMYRGAYKIVGCV